MKLAKKPYASISGKAMLIVLLAFASIPGGFDAFAENAVRPGASAAPATDGRKVGGTVTDENGNPVVGAGILVKGTGKGTVTDINGNYSLDVPQGATLVISCLGFIQQQIAFDGQEVINISLLPDTNLLDELVVVGYGTQKKGNLTTAISSIKSEQIVSTVSPSMAQRIQGKIPGVQIRQSSGAPGAYDSNINIRGFGTPIFIVDGVSRISSSEFQMLNPDDIENVTVLKDGAAAVYGMNAGNGVILVTTKHGQSGKAKFSYSGSVSLSSPTDIPEMCNAYQFVTLVNEANVNMGLPAVYSQNTVEKYRTGVPGYESVDWYGLVMKDNSVQQQHTISATGGTERVNYYLSFGYANDQGLLRSGDSNHNKFSMRANISAKLLESLRADVEMSGHYAKLNGPAGNNFFEIIRGTVGEQPLHKPYANDNPEYLNYVYDGQVLNPLALSDSDVTGYYRSRNKSFKVNAALTWEVPWVKGLMFKGTAYYEHGNGYVKSLAKTYRLYSYDSETGTYPFTQMHNPTTLDESMSDGNGLMFQVMGAYDRTFVEAHHVSATLAYEQRNGWTNGLSGGRDFSIFILDQLNYGNTKDQRTSASLSESGFQSLVTRLAYDYKGRYMIDFAGRYDGSYRYAPGHRWGFFPVVSVGWRASEEKFIKDNVKWLSNLKIRASYGEVGEDAGNPFQYVGGFTMNQGGFEFADGTWVNGASAPGLVNNNLTWYTSRMKNLGIDLGFFESRLNFSFDFYRRDRHGLLATRGASLPNTFGTSLPQENLNADRTVGLDFAIDFKTDIGSDWTIYGNANFNVARTMNTKLEQGSFANSYSNWRSNSLNRWNDVVWMYQVDGQFQNMDEIANAPIQNGLLGNSKELPGDYRFADLDHDGVIDGNDMAPIALSGSPKMFYGLTLGFRWKDLDFNMLWQGSAMYTVRFTHYYATMLWNDANMPAYFYDRWHHADPNDNTSEWIPGKWPAIRNQADVGSLYNESSVWRKDASYLRLKSLSLGYSLPKKWISKARLGNVRIGVAGYNILTICDKFVKPFDPEKIEGALNTGWVYPLNRSVNFELNLSF